MNPKHDICQVLRHRRLPTAVVDLDALDRNLEKLATLASKSGKKLRIATKSIRVPELIARVLAYGPPVEGLMCYSAEEAVRLSEYGFDNFLVAYPTLQEESLGKLRALHLAGKQVSIVVDQEEALGRISKFMSAAGPLHQPFPILFDFDVSTRLLWGLVHLGVRRSPLREPRELLKLLGKLANFPELKFSGVMAYEAQIAGLPDQNPFRPLFNLLARQIRRYSVQSVKRVRAEIADLLAVHHIPMEIFNGGGTGSIGYAAKESPLTELTIGSGLLCPHLFDYYSNLELEPACFFALEAVRASDPGYVTCQGGGYIASGEAGRDRLPLPVYPAGLSLISTEGCGEVQTPLKISGRLPIELGDPILFRHAKAGELAERFNDYLLISKGQIVGTAKTYRGLGWCFY